MKLITDFDYLILGYEMFPIEINKEAVDVFAVEKSDERVRTKEETYFHDVYIEIDLAKAEKSWQANHPSWYREACVQRDAEKAAREMCPERFKGANLQYDIVVSPPTATEHLSQCVNLTSIFVYKNDERIAIYDIIGDGVHEHSNDFEKIEIVNGKYILSVNSK